MDQAKIHQGNDGTAKHEALALARQGYYVFPIRVGHANAAGKRPKAPLVRWRTQSTTDWAQIEQWGVDDLWRGVNVGIDCERSGIVVLDDDTPDQVLAAALAERDTVLSFPSPTPRGAHHYFAASQHADQHSRVGIRPGIDVRGEGGCVVWYGGLDIPSRPERLDRVGDIDELLDAMLPPAAVPTPLQNQAEYTMRRIEKIVTDAPSASQETVDAVIRVLLAAKLVQRVEG